MASRIGRKYAQETYPEAPRAAASVAFARNSANGPSTDGPLPILTTLTPVPWLVIESKGSADQPANTFDIPITPKVTGIIRIIGSAFIQNSSTTPQNVELTVGVNGSNVAPFPTTVGVVPGGSGQELLTYSFDFIPPAPGAPLPLNTTATIQVSLIAAVNGTDLVLQAIDIDIQEVQAATG